MELPVDQSENMKQARPAGSLPAASPPPYILLPTRTQPREPGACCQLVLSRQPRASLDRPDC